MNGGIKYYAFIEESRWNEHILDNEGSLLSHLTTRLKGQ